jgi:alkanesulfonate monooxygenase
VPVHLYWFIPSQGDSLNSEPDIGYLACVARAAEESGFTGALVPTGLFCEDAWLVATALADATTDLRFMIAVRPGVIAPTLMAQMAATFQRISAGRLLLNVVTGGDPEELGRYGDWLDHAQRYERTDEFLTIMRGAWQGRVDFSGTHYKVGKSTVIRPPAVIPPIFVGGSSADAQRVAARHGDVYLCWGEPPPQTAELLAGFRQMQDGGRRVSTGTRLHVITRKTEEDAWAEARRAVERMDPAMVARAQRRFVASDSEGQRRMAAMHGGRAENLEVYPNLWAGYGLLRQGPGLSIVGSYEQVADRIAEYHALGLEHLVLSGEPHVDEAYAFGEGVVPLLRDRGLMATPGGTSDLAV